MAGVIVKGVTKFKHLRLSSKAGDIEETLDAKIDSIPPENCFKVINGYIDNDGNLVIISDD